MVIKAALKPGASLSGCGISEAEASVPPSGVSDKALRILQYRGQDLPV
jgi:hypothetical protein